MTVQPVVVPAEFTLYEPTITGAGLQTPATLVIEAVMYNHYAVSSPSALLTPIIVDIDHVSVEPPKIVRIEP